MLFFSVSGHIQRPPKMDGVFFFLKGRMGKPVFLTGRQGWTSHSDGKAGWPTPPIPVTGISNGMAVGADLTLQGLAAASTVPPMVLVIQIPAVTAMAPPCWIPALTLVRLKKSKNCFEGYRKWHFRCPNQNSKTTFQYKFQDGLGHFFPCCPGV